MEHIGLHLGKPLAIERHGEIVGYYIPVKKRNPEEVRRRLARLEEAIEQVLAETGMSEDELAEAFDLSKRSSSQAG
jgi:crotonobetainyl-CoA:carnitine CoA-transferase CaiB-like acyl-CoA transferase